MDYDGDEAVAGHIGLLEKRLQSLVDKRAALSTDADAPVSYTHPEPTRPY